MRELIRTHKPEVLFVQETFLNRGIKISVPGYHAFRLDRETHGGGLITFIKNTIKIHSVVPKTTNAFEALEVSIVLDNQSILKLINIYVPRDSRTFKNNFRALLTSEKTLFGGDWNAKSFLWCEEINNVGRKMAELLPFNGYSVAAPLDDTYINPNGRQSSKIDLFVTNVNEVIEVQVLEEYLSDHRPICTNINNRYLRAAPRSVFVYKDANWAVFRASIIETMERWAMPPDATPEQIDDCFDWCHEEILAARGHAVPTKMVSKPKDYQRSPVTDALLVVRKLLNQKLSAGGLTDSEHIETKRDIRENNRMLAKNFAIDRNTNWARFMAKANESQEQFWKQVKRARNIGERQTNVLTDAEGVTSSTPADMAEMLAEHFASAHAPVPRPPNPFDDECEQFAEEVRNDQQELECNPITVETVAACISRIKATKAPGVDQVTGTLVKQLPRAAMAKIAELFTRCLQIGHWPTTFKTAIVVAIPKRGKNQRSTDGYRPISLLPVVGKLFERIVADRLTGVCERNNIIPLFQYGFKAGHAADLQCSSMAATLQRNKAEKMNTGVLAFDVANAFPSLWPAGLAWKMKKWNFPAYLTRIVANFLTDRSMMVKAFGCLSTPRMMEAGTPQGSCISPIAYNIFTSDVPRDRNIQIFQFADDTAALAASKQKECPVRRLTGYCNKLTAYCDKWHLKLCARKTQYLYVPAVYHPNRFPNTTPSMEGQPLERSKTMTYLGVVFDDRLTFKQHLKVLAGKIAGKLQALFPVVLGGVLTKKNRLRIIKCIMWPSVTYAMAAWGMAPRAAKIALRRKFSSAAKTILRIPRSTASTYLYDVIQLPMLECAAIEARSKLLERLEKSTYDLSGLIESIHTAIEAENPE